MSCLALIQTILAGDALSIGSNELLIVLVLLAIISLIIWIVRH